MIPVKLKQEALEIMKSIMYRGEGIMWAIRKQRPNQDVFGHLLEHRNNWGTAQHFIHNTYILHEKEMFTRGKN